MKRLEAFTDKGGKRLRLGYTTGSCAAAAAKAAAVLLLTGECPSVVRLETPCGIALELDVLEPRLGEGTAFCSVQKDAGDDPDVTHGLRIGAAVSRISQGLEVDGGSGVGRFTLPGLPGAPGEAAINPVPRKMIAQSLREVLDSTGAACGLRALISVEKGEEVAAKTFNPRLGIVGGLSILGTSGIVEPMSEPALIASIQGEIKARRAWGEGTLLLTPGNYGRDFLAEAQGIPPERPVRCSNFIGEALDQGVASGFAQIVLLGHGGKLVKVAGGIFHTHSSVADARMEILAAHAALEGLEPERLRQLYSCVTVEGADRLLEQWGLRQAVWRGVGRKLAEHLEHRVGPGVTVAYGVFCRGSLAVSSPNLNRLLEDVKQEINQGDNPGI